MDAIPVFSQTKSLIQVIFKDKESARITQENFSRRCPVVSQLRSLVEAILGDKKAARATQIEQLKFGLSVLEGIPIVGHAIGTGYYIAKKKEWGDIAMKNASRTTGVVGGGILGFFTLGPPGSVALAATGGILLDGVTTGVESVIHEKFKTNGVLIPFADPKNPGKWADSVFLIVLDSLAGHSIGRISASIIARRAPPILPIEGNIAATVCAFSIEDGLVAASASSAFVKLVSSDKVVNIACKYITKYHANVYKWTQDLIKQLKNRLENEFHSLHKSLEIPQKSKPKSLTPEKLKKVKETLKKKTETTASSTQTEPCVVNIEEEIIRGKKHYIIMSEEANSSSQCEEEQQQFKLRRSRSGYF